MRKYSMNRFFYSCLLYLVLPFVPLKLLWRGIKQPEYRQHWGERFGFYNISINKPIIWLHCVSVGETRAAAPLVHALIKQYPQHQLLLSHSTPTGRATSEQLFGNQVLRIYLPYDLSFAVKRFLAYFKPTIGVLMETELWFNLIAACQQQSIPLLLVNARLSEKSAIGYKKLGQLTSQGLASLAAVAAQSNDDAARLQQLGANNVHVLGNLKFDVSPPENALAQGQQLRDLFGLHRPVFLAASTREGEEALILEAVKTANVPHLLTIIVPRHPQRFNEVEALLQQHHLSYQKRSTLAKPLGDEIHYLLGDSMGELFSYYASADVCLVGGSLLPFGGQNLIEPMRMGKAVIIGEHTFNFKEVSALAVAQRAAIRVSTTGELANTLRMLITNPPLQAKMGAKGLALCAASQGATQQTVQIIKSFLNQ